MFKLVLLGLLWIVEANRAIDGLVPLIGGPKRSTTRYWVSTFEATWLEAEIYCRQSGRALVSIETDVEQERLRFYLELNGYGDQFWGWWTSLNDVEEEGQFVWFATGERALYTNFVKDSSGAIWNEKKWDCVIISGPWEYHWQIRPCSDRLQFICEV